MKRFVLLAVFGGFLAAAPATAQVSVYGAGGLASPTGDDMEGIDAGLQLVGGLEFDLTERLSIFGEGQWGTHGGDFGADGKVKPSALMAGLLLGLTSNEDAPISPYVFGGVGLQKVKLEGQEGSVSVSIDDSTLGWQGGAGIGFDLAGLGAFLEGRYQAASFDEDSDFEAFDFAMFSILFGLSFDLGGDN